MFSIDLNKIKPLEDIHWKWFWNRAEKNTIEICLKGKEFLSLNYREFWRIFLGWNEKDLRKILFASKREMLDMIDECDLFYIFYKNHLMWMNESISMDTSSNEENLKKIKNAIYDSFGYNDFESNGSQLEDGRTLRSKYGANWRKKRNLWNAYTFTRGLDINVCPYCGRQYTFTLGNGDEEKYGRPQIDHFFPEAEFPFLSCSLYNFIPSCSSCNHQKSDTYNNPKKAELKKLPYPYENIENGKKKLYDEVKFKAFYQFEEKTDEVQGDKLCYGIKLRNNENKLVDVFKNANEAFHLEDLYSMHDLELEDLFTRYRVYTKSRLKNILSVIHAAQNSFDESLLKDNAFYKDVISTESYRLKKVILGFPLGSQDRQYPLRKFKEDIVAQLDKTYKTMGK